MKSKAHGCRIHYTYDLDGHLMADAITGTTSRDYIWMAANDDTPVDMPLAVAEAANLYMVHTDHLGRPTRMTDATKATVWQASYGLGRAHHSLRHQTPQPPLPRPILPDRNRTGLPPPDATSSLTRSASSMDRPSMPMREVARG
jgi:uncharacterized protein RhaS with RHS repeats